MLSKYKSWPSNESSLPGLVCMSLPLWLIPSSANYCSHPSTLKGLYSIVSFCSIITCGMSVSLLGGRCEDLSLSCVPSTWHHVRYMVKLITCLLNAGINRFHSWASSWSACYSSKASTRAPGLLTHLWLTKAHLIAHVFVNLFTSLILFFFLTSLGFVCMISHNSILLRALHPTKHRKHFKKKFKNVHTCMDSVLMNIAWPVP